MINLSPFFTIIFCFIIVFKAFSLNTQSRLISKEISLKKRNINYNSFTRGYNYGHVSDKVYLTIDLLGKDVFHIRITDPKVKKFEVPREIINWRAFDQNLENIDLNEIDLEISSSNGIEFSLNSNRNNSDFQMLSDSFVFSTYFNSFSYKLSSDLIFGYGERAHKFKLEAGTYTIWNNDTTLGTIIDDKQGGRNLYGHQPFILNRGKDGYFVGILFINTNAQDLIISEPFPDGSVKVEQRSIGGIIEIIIILDKLPVEVIKKYHKLIGLPLLPPLWGLGWHQSRYGYPNDSVVDEVVEKYNSLDLPLDSIWTDINYMNKFQDFTIDPITFPNLPNLVDKWNSNGINFIPILDIGIFHDKLNPYFLFGLKYNCFIISNYTKQPLLSQIWPGRVSFPDFTHPNTSFLWEQGLTDFFTLVKFDGLWLDVNEPQSLVKDPFGEIIDTYNPNKNKYKNIPYIPGNGRIMLEQKSISLNGLLYGKGLEYSEENTIFYYKALNPYYQIRMTNEYIMKNFNRRPFILSRANVFGMGKYANHWLGDNLSTYEQMRLSIPGVFNYQMFGFNLVGADICGFLLDVTDDLCARWHILGAFYPFARNHNNINQTAQEPWKLGKRTLESAKIAIRLKYSLIRYFYTYSFLMSLEGGMYFQPIFFEFPNDNETYNHLDEQIILGKSLLFSPALQKEENDFEVYFPNANWNEFPSGISVMDYNKISSKGKLLKLNGAYSNLHLHLRGGSIIPYQDVTSYNITRSHHLLNISTELIINPDHENKAIGVIIYDDGISLEAQRENKYIHLKVSLNETVINFELINSFDVYFNNDIRLDSITIFRGKKWSEYNSIEIKSIFGDVYELKGEYDRIKDVYKIKSYQKMKMNEIGFILFSNVYIKENYFKFYL